MDAILGLSEPEAAGVSSAALACIDAMLAELIAKKPLPGPVKLADRRSKTIHRRGWR